MVEREGRGKKIEDKRWAGLGLRAMERAPDLGQDKEGGCQGNRGSDGSYQKNDSSESKRDRDAVGPLSKCKGRSREGMPEGERAVLQVYREVDHQDPLTKGLKN